jgi:hypothetical protein
MACKELIWIRSSVEHMASTVEYLSISRVDWESMTQQEQNQMLIDVALETMSNAGGCGASVVEDSEVPDEWRVEELRDESLGGQS